MKLAIMQPYFFPYIGYWQLINAVDTFIIYDDVNFIKQGYINKNNILSKNTVQPITLELRGASSNRLIKEVGVGNNGKKLLKTIKQNYIKTPYFKDVLPILEEILNNEEKNLALYLGFSIKKIATYLQINTNLLYSSEVQKDCELKAQDKVIDICRNINASSYINAIGGQELYDKQEFKNNNIELSFIKTELKPYNQFNHEFIPYLSIIDIMMFNDVKIIKNYLENYILI